MDKFSVHFKTTCCNAIKECGSEVDYILGGYTFKLQVMDVGVNKPFKGYVREAYENFMIGNPENRRGRREDIIQCIQTGGGGGVKVETSQGHATKLQLMCRMLQLSGMKLSALLTIVFHSFEQLLTSHIL